LEVSKIEIAIPENVNLTGETQVVMAQERARFAKTPGELNKLFHQFCRANIGSFAPVDSTPALEMALKMFFEEYLNYGKLDTVKIILYPQNQPAFIELITKSLDLYTLMLEEKANKAQKDIQTYTWEVPAERVYNENYEEQVQEIHILEPYYESVKASKPEKCFANYLENKSEHITWWYKNGESAKEHFAIPYSNYFGKKSLFYVDFVILTKSKVTCLFDTKTAGSDAANAHLKHNALIDYIATRNAKGKKSIGGIIIGNELNGTWRYCQNKIENTVDLNGWEFFKPEEL
jgi:type III restriction enzyme